MKLDRQRAQQLVALLSEVPSSANAVKAITAQLRDAANTEIDVNEGWIANPAMRHDKVRQFAAQLDQSSFSAFRPAQPRTPFSQLPRFTVAEHWDMDSTPQFARELSRKLGTRPPAIEAAIMLASLKHDIRYYYAGDVPAKTATDAAFAEEIRTYGQLLGVDATLASIVDQFAVTLGGGAPFKEAYSWSYGVPVAERGYTPLAAGQKELIESHATAIANDVIRQLAAGTFVFTPQQQAVLIPSVKASLQQLARALVERGL